MDDLDLTPEVPQKRCNKCGEMFPATPDFFYKDKRAPDGLYARCKKCHNKQARTWQKEHPEAAQEITKRYRENNPERYKEQCRKSRLKNRAKAHEYEREYYRRNRDRIHAKNAARRKRHPEPDRRYNAKERREHPEQIARRQKRYRERNYAKVRAREKQYNIDHPEYKRAAVRRRRARMLESEGSYTEADVKAQYQRQKGKCYWCGEKLDPDNYEPDHVIPLSRSKDNSKWNIVCVHPRCNRSKSGKLPHEWEGNGGKLL